MESWLIGFLVIFAVADIGLFVWALTHQHDPFWQGYLEGSNPLFWIHKFFRK